MLWHGQNATEKTCGFGLTGPLFRVIFLVTFILTHDCTISACDDDCTMSACDVNLKIGYCFYPSGCNYLMSLSGFTGNSLYPIGATSI